MGNETKKIKVYCETTVIGDMTARPSPLIRNLARRRSVSNFSLSVASLQSPVDSSVGKRCRVLIIERNRAFREQDEVNVSCDCRLGTVD